MADIKAWLQKRQLRKSEPMAGVKSMFRWVAETYGPEAHIRFGHHLLSSCAPLAIEYARRLAKSESPEVILETLHKAATDRDTRSAMLASSPSHALTKGIEESVAISWTNVLSHMPSMLDLTKKIKHSTWQMFVANHSPEAAALVDHSYHVEKSSTPQAYKDMLASPSTQPGLPNPGGIVPKMTHDVKSFHKPDHPENDTLSGTVMAKPYHKRAEPGTESFCPHPIFGWSTMTTNRLFHAAGIGHMAEKVHTYEHQGIPMTVHEFAPNMDAIYGADRNRQHVNGTDLGKLAVMDFLTNNVDRHGGNLLTDENHANVDPATGKNRLLAIDHERGFQYMPSTPSREREFVDESPYDNLRGGGIGAAMEFASVPDFQHISSWWKSHSAPIRDEIEKNLFTIKDQNLREHIRNNFKDRVEWMDKWAGRVADKPGYTSQDLKKDRGVVARRFMQPSADDVKKLSDALPGDPKEAFNQINDWAQKRAKFGLKGQDIGAVHDALMQRIATSKPEQITDLFIHALQNPKFQNQDLDRLSHYIDPRQLIMEHLRHNRDPKVIDSLIEGLISRGNPSGNMLGDYPRRRAITELRALKEVDPKIETLAASEDMSW